MKSTTLLLLILISVSSAGCAAMIGDFCDVARPTRPSPEAAAQMSTREKADIVKHNEYGADACGWKP